MIFLFFQHESTDDQPEMIQSTRDHHLPTIRFRSQTRDVAEHHENASFSGSLHVRGFQIA